MTDLDALVVATREDTYAVSAAFRDHQAKQNAMTVADLNAALGLASTHYSDMNTGWLSPVQPVFKPVDDGYQIILPEPVRLKWVSA